MRRDGYLKRCKYSVSDGEHMWRYEIIVCEIGIAIARTILLYTLLHIRLSLLYCAVAFISLSLPMTFQ